MTRNEILRLVDQSGAPIELECMACRYVFDFSCLPHDMGNRACFELGRHDADVPVVVDPSNGYIYFLHGNTLSFINSSFARMIQAFEMVNEWNIPDDLPDAERASLFRTRMVEIDPECFRDPEACWSTMREEIEYGVI